MGWDQKTSTHRGGDKKEKIDVGGITYMWQHSSNFIGMITHMPEDIPRKYMLE